MRRALLTLIVGVACAARPPARPSADSHHALVIRGATVIDVTSAVATTPTNIWIVDERIVAIGDQPPRWDPAARVLAGEGKFVIPGLWDMHVHLGGDDARPYLPALVAQGVTTIRDMGTPLDAALRLREATRTGAIVGPHILTPGPLFNRKLPFDPPMVLQIGSVGDVEGAVERLKRAGVDFVKIADSLQRDVYFAVIEAARRLGLRVVGHIPPSISAEEASNAGQASVEHLGGRFQAVLIGCSRDEAVWQARASAVLESAIAEAFAGKEPDALTIVRSEFVSGLLASYDDAKALRLFARFANNHTWQVPTLVAIRAFWDDPALNDDDRRAGDQMKQRQLDLVRQMRAAGVRILAGTDQAVGSAPTQLPEELELLVHAGATPREALASATRDAAEFAGVTDRGQVAVGQIADLVVLDADPTRDVAAVRRVSAVVLGGRVVPAPRSSPAP